MCEKNDNSTEQIVRMTSDEFFDEMKSLLSRAPENMVYVLNAMEDPESGTEGRSVIAVNGSCMKIGYAFRVAFDQDRRFDHVINHAVDYCNFAKSGRRGSFRGMSDFEGDRPDLSSLLDKLFKK